MKNTLFTLCVLFLQIILFTSMADASRSPEAPKCYFIGKVQDVQARKEKGQGISEGKTYKYIDISIHKIKKTDKEKNVIGCSNEKIQTFQMHRSFLGIYAPSLPKKYDCIKGYSNYLADGNFMSGNWLTIEEALPLEACD